MENSKKCKFNYAWVIIGVTALMVCVALGFCSSSKGLFLKAITDALGISRSAFSVNDSCRYISTAIINLFFGTLIARFGAKKLVGAGFICLIASCLIYSFASNIFIFYIGGCLLGIGLSWTTTTMVGYVVNIWHKENKGTIMGAILASNGIGAAVATQILSPVIHSGVYGYRNAYRLAAIILFAVFVIVMVFFKSKPKRGFLEHTEATHKKAKSQSWVGIEYSSAVKKTYFYGMLLCIFICGMVLQGITGIATPHLYDRGIDEAYVAIIVSCHSLALTVFKFLTGIIYDKFGIRISTNICVVSAIIAFALLSVADNSAQGRTYAIIYEVIATVALPLETIMLPLFASDLFGERSFSKILGIFVSVNTAGYALGAPISNLCYDIMGNYNVALYAGCVLMLIVIVVVNVVITAANRERRAVIEADKETVSVN